MTMTPNSFRGGPGALVTQGLNRSQLNIPRQQTRRQADSSLAFAIGPTEATILDDDSVVTMSSIENTYESEGCKLATIVGSAQTLKKEGVYLVNFTARVEYQSATGTSGVTMREALTTLFLTAGASTDLLESQGFATLSSRRNITGLATFPTEDPIFYHATHETETAAPDTDEPTAWHGNSTTQGIWTVWVTEINPGADLLIQGSEILTNITKVAEYASATVASYTIYGQAMIRVVLDPTPSTGGLKIKRGSSLLSPTLTLKGSTTYVGEGDADPIAVCTACTMSIQRITLHADLTPP